MLCRLKYETSLLWFQYFRCSALQLRMISDCKRRSLKPGCLFRLFREEWSVGLLRDTLRTRCCFFPSAFLLWWDWLRYTQKHTHKHTHQKWGVFKLLYWTSGPALFQFDESLSVFPCFSFLFFNFIFMSYLPPSFCVYFFFLLSFLFFLLGFILWGPWICVR